MIDKILFEDSTQSRKETAAIRRRQSAVGRIAGVQDRSTALDTATQRTIRLFTHCIASQYDMAGVILNGHHP
jgi:hypothetical protein